MEVGITNILNLCHWGFVLPSSIGFVISGHSRRDDRPSHLDAQLLERPIREGIVFLPGPTLRLAFDPSEDQLELSCGDEAALQHLDPLILMSVQMPRL